MKKLTNLQIAEEIYFKTLEIFRIYNSVIRTPSNWAKERERLLSNPDNRAKWLYKVPEVRRIKDQVEALNVDFKSVNNKKTDNIYLKFLLEVVEATVNTALLKAEILEGLSDFKPTLNLRNRFYELNFDYSKIEEQYSSLLKNSKVIEIGRRLGKQDITTEEAAEIVRKSIEEVRFKIRAVIKFPAELEEKILRSLTAEVEVLDNPSFSMRCTNDPKTNTIKVLLNKRRKYSRPLLKIAYLHEFCGHAVEMAVFDRTLVRDGVIPKIYSYAGVSSPSIFDVKAEVFADLIVVPFIEEDERKYVQYRRDIWLVCRAMADYLYNIKGKTIKDVMQVYEAVGLEDFAFDEAIMASIFIDGYQGMYLFANMKIEKLKKNSHLNDKDLLTFLLFMGKIPVDKFIEFKNSFSMQELTKIYD